jgi:hypothetical protein
MKKILALSIIMTTFVIPYVAAETTWTPDPATIQKLELAVGKAEGGSFQDVAVNIESYARYYAGTIEEGHRVVHGVFINADLQHLSALYRRGDAYSAGIHIVSRGQLPSVADGGCSIINVNYDADSRQLVSIHCHNEKPSYENR